MNEVRDKGDAASEEEILNRFYDRMGDLSGFMKDLASNLSRSERALNPMDDAHTA